MKNIWKYLLIGVLVFGILAIVAMPIFARFFGFYPGYGMMGYGMMTQAPASWAGVGGFRMLGGLMMLLIMGLPVALVVLAIAGGFSLLNRPSTTVTPPAANSPSAARTCAACGKPAQSDWSTCPYCGQRL